MVTIVVEYQQDKRGERNNDKMTLPDLFPLFLYTYILTIFVARSKLQWKALSKSFYLSSFSFMETFLFFFATNPTSNNNRNDCFCLFYPSMWQLKLDRIWARMIQNNLKRFTWADTKMSGKWRKKSMQTHWQ